MKELESYLQTKLQGEYSKVTKILTESSTECSQGLCDGKGAIFYEVHIEDQGDYEYHIDCACCSAQKSNAEFSRVRSKMPFDYMDKTVKDFDWSLYGSEDVKTLKSICNSFIAQFGEWEKQGKGLYLYSKTMGSGKTLLSCILANEVSKRHYVSIRFTTVSEYLSIISDEMKAERGELKESEAVKNAQLLILDDVGNTAKKDWTDTQMYELINYRLSNKKVTIFTSNVLPQALKIDSRVNERIEKMAISVCMPEISVRKMKADQENEEFLRQIFQRPTTGQEAIGD